MENNKALKSNLTEVESDEGSKAKNEIIVIDYLRLMRNFKENNA